MVEDDEVRITLRLPTSLRDRLAESAKGTSRSMNGEIVARLEQSFEDLELDLASPIIQNAMIDRIREMMGAVVEDMREEQRISNGVPLLLQWFDENPNERSTYDAMSDEEQDEFVRDKTQELWFDYLKQRRQTSSEKQSSSKGVRRLTPKPDKNE